MWLTCWVGCSDQNIFSGLHRVLKLLIYIQCLICVLYWWIDFPIKSYLTEKTWFCVSLMQFDFLNSDEILKMKMNKHLFFLLDNLIETWSEFPNVLFQWKKLNFRKWKVLQVSGIRFSYTNQPFKPANFLLPYWYTPSFTDTFYKIFRVLKQVISSVSKLPFALLSERATQNLLATWPGMD